MRAAAARNVFKATLLVAILAAMFAGVGWLLAAERGAVAFAFASLLAATAVYAAGDRALLGTLGARRLAEAEHPRLRTSVARLSTALGVLPPRLYVLPDGLPRALVVGRGPRSAALAVSPSLLSLRDEELDGVLAHELAHVRSRDVLTQTFASLFAWTLLELSRIGGWFSGALLAVLAPVGAAFTHLLLSPRRELAADATAAALTDPHDVADALLRLDAASELVEFAASPATEPLYTVSPFDHTERIPRMFSTHPPVADRVGRLRAVAAGSGRG